MIRRASLPLLLLASLLALACERGDDLAGDSGAAGAAPDAVGAALPAGEDGAAGSDAADPAPSGPGTEPPTQPSGATPPPPQDGDQNDDQAMEPPASSDPEPVGDPAMTPDPGAGALDGAGSCDLSKTRLQLEDRPLQEGDLCDDVVVCAPDAASADALVGAAPEFDCDAGENVLGLCSGDQLPCVWRPGVLDASEMDSVCAATGVLAEDGELVCVVYL